jgi:hypothetical protein
VPRPCSPISCRAPSVRVTGTGEALCRILSGCSPSVVRAPSKARSRDRLSSGCTGLVSAASRWTMPITRAHESGGKGVHRCAKNSDVRCAYRAVADEQGGVDLVGAGEDVWSQGAPRRPAADEYIPAGPLHCVGWADRPGVPVIARWLPPAAVMMVARSRCLPLVVRKFRLMRSY